MEKKKNLYEDRHANTTPMARHPLTTSTQDRKKRNVKGRKRIRICPVCLHREKTLSKNDFFHEKSNKLGFYIGLKMDQILNSNGLKSPESSLLR